VARISVLLPVAAYFSVKKASAAHSRQRLKDLCAIGRVPTRLGALGCPSQLQRRVELKTGLHEAHPAAGRFSRRAHAGWGGGTRCFNRRLFHREQQVLSSGERSVVIRQFSNHALILIWRRVERARTRDSTRFRFRSSRASCGGRGRCGTFINRVGTAYGDIGVLLLRAYRPPFHERNFMWVKPDARKIAEAQMPSGQE
jgi:hypothetical protein